MTAQAAANGPSQPLGRYSNVSMREARAAARARVTVDRRRGRQTPRWIVDLAERRTT